MSQKAKNLLDGNYILCMSIVYRLVMVFVPTALGLFAFLLVETSWLCSHIKTCRRH
jgi:hypothetical protein